MNFKNLLNFKEKRYGFYVNLVLGVLLIISGILYAVNFQTNDVVLTFKIDYNPVVTALLLVAGIVGIIMSLFKVTDKFAPYVEAILMLTTLCLFIQNVYLFVMNCFVDIDFHPADFAQPVFLVPFIFIILTFVLSIVTVFLPQSTCACSKNKENCTCGECCHDEKEEVEHE